MHEVSVAMEIIEGINNNIKIYNLKSVDKITLSIGEFTCIDENSLRFAFFSMSKGTIFENAKLAINKIKAISYCDYCKEEFNITYTNKICPKCNKFSFNLIKGDEIILESIEGE